MDNLLVRHNENFILLAFDVELLAFDVEVQPFDMIKPVFEMVLPTFDMVPPAEMVLPAIDMVHNIHDGHSEFVNTYTCFHKQLVTLIVVVTMFYMQHIHKYCEDYLERYAYMLDCCYLFR